MDHELPSKVTARPPLSVATQNADPTHDIPVSMLSAEAPEARSTMTGRLQVEPFHVTTLPSLSPATQKSVLVHDTDTS